MSDKWKREVLRVCFCVHLLLVSIVFHTIVWLVASSSSNSYLTNCSNPPNISIYTPTKKRKKNKLRYTLNRHWSTGPAQVSQKIKANTDQTGSHLVWCSSNRKKGYGFLWHHLFFSFFLVRFMIVIRLKIVAKKACSDSNSYKCFARIPQLESKYRAGKTHRMRGNTQRLPDL